ncbi:MAG TPA: hypothetical protein VFU65_01745 [Actinocrinis sp.]|nr:hypothetical protein [Actinocrinis sp.]
MRRVRKPDDDDVPMLEIELIGEPDEEAGGAVEREELRRRGHRLVGRLRRSARRNAVLVVAVTTAVAVGAIATRMWDDRAGERADQNRVTASISLVPGGTALAAEPTSATVRGSVDVVVHNVGSVPFSLVDVATDVPNVRIVAVRVVGDALVPPGGNGRFGVTFTTDCSRVRPPGSDADERSGDAARMPLSVRTAGRQLRTVAIPVLRPVAGQDEDWTIAQQSACGADAPPPMILAWPETAHGFPKASVHGNTATVPVAAILQRSRPATLRSIGALAGVGIETPDLPLTLRPRSPIAAVTLTIVVTDCAAAVDATQFPYLDARVEDSGSSWATGGGATSDNRVALAIVGAISEICGH